MAGKCFGAAFAAIVLLAAGAARADLTIEGTSTPGASGGADRYTIYIRDEQMRVDQYGGAGGDEVTSSMIIRFAGSPAGMLFLDHGARTVNIVPLDAVAATGQAFSASAGTESSAQPVVGKNETREVMGRTTEGYDFAFSGTATPPGMETGQLPPGMAEMLEVRLDVNGTAWVAPDVDGAEELAAFYTRMAENGITFGGAAMQPRADGSGETAGYSGMSDGFTHIMAEIARKGFPLRTEMTTDVTVDAEGPMAGMLKEMMSGAMGSSTHVSEVAGVSTDTVDADLFFGGGLPEGYEENVISLE